VRLREIPFADISAGDLSPDGQHLLLRREDGAWMWSRGPGETIAAALANPPRRMPVIGPPAEPNGEAIAWSTDGRGYYTLSEGKRQPIYYLPIKTNQPAAIAPR